MIDLHKRIDKSRDEILEKLKEDFKDEPSGIVSSSLAAAAISFCEHTGIPIVQWVNVGCCLSNALSQFQKDWGNRN